MRTLVLLWLAASGAAAQDVVRGRVTSRDVRVRGAIVWLEPLDAPVPPAAGDTITMDQFGLAFVPDRLVLRPGDVVVFPNSDPLRHNVFSPGLRNAAGAFNLGTYPRGEARSHTFTEPGAHVILCHIHPDMLAWVVVVDSPWHATVGRDGTFRLEGVPPGRYRLHAWHARARAALVPIRVGGGAAAPVTVELVRP